MATTGSPESISAWRQRAVERSLGAARTEALNRSDQFLEAAMELLHETGRIDFTVQDILDRSHLSLRAFYKFFGSKDELLLALFEELLGAFVAELRSEVEAETDPRAQLHAYVVGFYARAEQAPGGGARALALYQVQMAEGRQDEIASALAPQIELLREVVQRGIDSGTFRRDLDAAVLTHLLTVTLTSVAQMTVLGIHLGGVEVDADRLWAWCWQAVAAPPARAETTTTSRNRKAVGAAPAAGKASSARPKSSRGARRSG